MPPPSAEAGIHIEADGGSRAAAELGKASTGLDKTGQAHQNMNKEFARGVQTTGLVSLGREMTMATGLNAGLTTGLVGLITTMKAAAMGAGGLAVTLSIIAAVLGAAAAAFSAFNQKSEQMAKQLIENNKKLAQSIKLFEVAEASTRKLTQAETFFLGQLKAVHAARLKLIEATTKDTIEKKRNEAAATTGWAVFKRNIAVMGGSTTAAEAFRLKQKELRLEANRFALDLLAMADGFASYEDMVKTQTAESEKFASALKDMRAEAQGAADALRVMDPGEKYKVETEGIERTRQAKLSALSEMKSSDEDYADSLRLINETAANQTTLAWQGELKRVSDAHQTSAEKAQQDWEKSTAFMVGAAENFAVSLSQSMTSGTFDAGQAFKQLGDAVVAEVSRMIAKTLILKALTASIGGPAGGGIGSVLGFQHGGQVPGAIGAPRLIMAHGGERVVSDTGRGGSPGGGGGGTTNNYTFRTGVLTADSQRAMVRQISRTQGSTGERAFPR